VNKITKGVLGDGNEISIGVKAEKTKYSQSTTNKMRRFSIYLFL